MTAVLGEAAPRVAGLSQRGAADFQPAGRRALLCALRIVAGRGYLVTGAFMRAPSRFAILIPCAAIAALLAASPAAHGAPAGLPVDIPFEQFVLPNGLRVLVHTDRKAPIVAVNIWYHVGSKNEAR